MMLRMRVYITVFLRNRKTEFHFHFLFSISAKLENDIRTSSFVFDYTFIFTHSKNGIRCFGFPNEISNPFSRSVVRAVARPIIAGGGCIFIYSCSSRRISFEIVNIELRPYLLYTHCSGRIFKYNPAAFSHM